jgi:hypothetical protein
MNAETSTASQPLTRTRYGTANPERAENMLWERAIREDWSGYGLRQHLGVGLDGNSHFCQDFSHSTYRETTPGPFWSWLRYGRTSTALPDGRIIHIAGEHEDAYDNDFCIYNDVVVEYPGGRREFYLYPKDVFPPTDFHSATLVDHEIVLIGSLGYRDLRRVGETQVLKLDTRTLCIEQVATEGEGAGWISRHIAEKLGETAILVIGGKVQTRDNYEPNAGIFELDLTAMTWRRREHGDMSLFPIAEVVYRKNKNPRYGTANPERSNNPFWLEVARRQWPPSRARLHFGDFAPPEPEPMGPGIDRSELVRTIDDVVWTAVRECALKCTLPDGRNLMIGGEVPDYGDEYADPWVYNDVIAIHPGGAIEILTYPKDVFPHIIWPDGVLMGEDLYIFGIIERKRHQDRSRGPAVLRLNTLTYEMTPVPAADPRARVNVYPSSGVRDGNCVVFPIRRDRKTDPEQCIAFEFGKLAWGEPYPHPRPVDD